MASVVPSGLHARDELSMPNGGVVRVEIDGVEDAERLAKHALSGAFRAFEDAHAVAQIPGEEEGSYAGIIGKSKPMRELFRMLERLRTTSATILITGENGSGKELVARAIHDRSPRAQKRFVAANCSAFNDNLLESEFFGHKRGAFTGAGVDKPGLFEIADGGTFFMDEVGDMSPALQVKLLRVLQEGTFLPVGGTEARRVDVRVIAATNRDLSGMVARGEFREDLYYRLHVVALRVPPLRERPEDIASLVEYFLTKLAKTHPRRKVISTAALALLEAHHWPGNVRELENDIERLWVLSGDDPVISDSLLADRPRSPASPITGPNVAGSLGGGRTGSAQSLAPSTPEPMRLPEAVETLERRMILDCLRRVGGNKTRAAEELGISRRNLIRKVQAYALEATALEGAASEDDAEPHGEAKP